MDASHYRFGPFSLDSAQRRLSSDGEVIELNGRYFDALRLMVANAGQLISKDRFNTEVWSGVPVTDEALTQCIKALRKALGDDASAPRFIETVPKHGYRFIAPTSGGDGGGNGHVRQRFSAIAIDTAAGAIGGALAGIIGAVAYVTAGLVAPGLGSASIALALISLCLGLGLLGGLATALGLSLAGGDGRSLLRAMAGGGLGGLAIGALSSIVGRDLFTLLFGRAPLAFTGAIEAALLGMGLGTSIWAAERIGGDHLRRLAPSALIGAASGGLIVLGDGRLFAGSIAELSRSFPDSPLRFDALSAPVLAAATMLEAGLFCLCVTAALLTARRLRGD